MVADVADFVVNEVLNAPNCASVLALVKRIQRIAIAEFNRKHDTVRQT
jgi:hypothetical protein